MELKLVFDVLRRRWWLVLIPVLVVAVFVVPDFLTNRSAVSGGFTTTVRYSASQVLEAIPGRDGDFQDVWLASELAVNALTDWVRTTSFVDEIVRGAAAEGVEVNPVALGIAADNRRSVGQLTISYPDSAVLETVINTAIDVLETRSQDYFPQLGGQPAQVTVLDIPTVVSAPPSLPNRFAPFIRLGLGLFVGLVLAFLSEYLDPTVRRRQQVEEIGLPVIATLPRD